ncbi:DUF2798 domain-containing protein [Alkanindiges sp. WGS2144]|uniref:DUF2798 domain-containing protein n=1 Tax=Alkanindiges sp. WGS2144 TaxID=3366808 RepID=UPI003751771F
MSSPTSQSPSAKTIFGFNKLPVRYLAVIMPLILSFMMSGIISFISTLKSMGIQPELLMSWLMAWAISWLVAFPTVLVILPIARRFALLFVQSPQS